MTSCTGRSSLPIPGLIQMQPAPNWWRPKRLLMIVHGPPPMICSRSLWWQCGRPQWPTIAPSRSLPSITTSLPPPWIMSQLFALAERVARDADVLAAGLEAPLAEAALAERAAEHLHVRRVGPDVDAGAVAQVDAVERHRRQRDAVRGGDGDGHAAHVLHVGTNGQRLERDVRAGVDVEAGDGRPGLADDVQGLAGVVPADDAQLREGHRRELDDVARGPTRTRRARSARATRRRASAPARRPARGAGSGWTGARGAMPAAPRADRHHGTHHLSRGRGGGRGPP